MLPSKGLQVIALFLTLFPEILPAQEQSSPPCSLEQLACMSWPELEALYRQSCAGSIPHGYAHGRPIYCPDKKLSGPRTAVARMLWHGKHFCDDGRLVNQWTGFKAVRARVFYGPSWLDGKPSIIADYCGESRLVWADVRDELREVAPGLYLGIMYRRRCCGPKFDSFFALQLCP
jgi:hypothetical protein